MQVIYSGPFDTVDVPALDLTVLRGVPVEVDEGAGLALCEQDDWSEVAPSKSKKSTTPEEG